MLRPFPALPALFALAACAGSDVALDSFDPLSASLTNYTVAVALEPETAAYRPLADLTISATRPSGETLSETFDLIEIGRLPEGPVSATRYFVLDPEDSARLANLQDTVSTWKSEGTGTVGTFSVEASFCSTGDVGPEILPLVSVWLRPSPDAPFIPIVEEFDPATVEEVPVISGPCPT